MTKIEEGSKVKCLAGNIDRGLGAGEVGYVTGFARFSSYHPREVWVSDNPDGLPPRAAWCGWFWESAVSVECEAGVQQ